MMVMTDVQFIRNKIVGYHEENGIPVILNDQGCINIDANGRYHAEALDEVYFKAIEEYPAYVAWQELFALEKEVTEVPVSNNKKEKRL